MKVYVRLNLPGLQFEGEFVGSNAENVVAAMQKTVADRAGFIAGLAIKSLSPLAFAQEATRRYAAAQGRAIADPASCAEFIEFGVREGMAEVRQP